MTFRIRAHFDGRVLVPDQPVDLPLNQPLEVDVTPCAANGMTNGVSGAGPADRTGQAAIAERLRKLEALNGLIPGAVIPLDALRRENLYDERV